MRRFRRSGKLNVIDWLVHGGHQYEFFKSDCNFYCALPSGKAPNPKDLGRPKNENVKYVDEREIRRKIFDIIIVRAGIDSKRYYKYRYKKGSPLGVAVMQTYLPFKVPKWVRCIVWNSKSVMDKHRGLFSGKKHFYIPHGFDPKEFDFLNLKRNGRAISASSLFKQRGDVLGFNEWLWVSKNLKKCDLLGHGNNRLKESIGSFPLEKLVRTYNKYSVFLNTTTKSAMPRARAEALMCGTPLVTTNNFGINRYLRDGESCLFADTKGDMLKAVNKILSSNQMQQDLGAAGREAAIEHFNIKDYLDKWNYVFEEAGRM